VIEPIVAKFASCFSTVTSYGSSFGWRRKPTGTGIDASACTTCTQACELAYTQLGYTVTGCGLLIPIIIVVVYCVMKKKSDQKKIGSKAASDAPPEVAPQEKEPAGGQEQTPASY